MMILLVFNLMKRATEEYSIYSDRFKREVDEAHQLFFEKRGIDIKTLDGDFLFGSKTFRKFREDNPSRSPHGNDLPTSQSSQVKNYSPQL